ncbi:Rne/Rng family ribonuclease [Bacillus sp. V3B]|uniref:Rne/Rng family ribonuclease n=1 Tax=Bacillus sp. V3B TaxID=2804915 RepID=UPI00210DDC51|nr:Rne/Rng family ribonuclease [Bacillus sp. V3B]MCQ6273532.1 Rne/Rng family ribonuclease [Bacillus sp. V3B]
MKKLIVNYLTREKRFALLEDQKVEKLVVKQPKHASIVGNIYMGTVTKVLPGMNAAFVDIGEGKNGFIHRNKLASFVQSEEEKGQKEKRGISSFVHQGERLMVQVEKDATGTKGPRLTAVIELSGNHLIYMPKGRYVAVSKKIEQFEARERCRRFGYEIKQKEEGIIFRTSSESASEQEIRVELDELRSVYDELESKAKSMKKTGKLYEQDHFFTDMIAEIKPISDSVEMIVDERELVDNLKKIFPLLPISLHTAKENIFSVYHLDGELEKALKRIVWLDNGAYLVMDEVEALTIIDVNTGKFSGKHDIADTILKTNRLAAIETARQIRLRDLGGMILIDFIDMKNDHERNQVMEVMQKELQKDGRRTNILGFTPLGILQLTRKKTKVSLSESLKEKCPLCEGTGKIASAETIAFRLERELYEYRNGDIEEVVIELTDEVKKVFCGEQNIHSKRLEDLLGFTFTFTIRTSDQPFYHIGKLR